MRRVALKQLAGHKLLLLKAVAPASLVAVLLLITPAGLYADTGTWVDGDMPTLSVDAVSTQFPQLPGPCFKASYTYFTYGTNPNNLGHIVDATGCESENTMGSFIDSNPNNTSDSYDFIKPGTSIAFRVLHPGGRQITVTPVPNGSGFMWVEPSNFWGNPVAPHFFTNFASAGDFGQYYYGSNIVPWDLAYELNTNGTILTDSAGAKIYMKAYAFSQNGEWMVMEAYGLGTLRVNMQTFQMQLIDQTKLAYNLGLSPTMALAISNDGNSVIRSVNLDGSTVVYDLTNCQPGSFTIAANNVNAVQGCQSRNVQQSLQSQLATFQYMTNMQFSPDGKSVTGVAVGTGLNGIRLYNSVHYSVAGYQAPHLSYLALGDSFSSGEGAYDYVLGTNEPENTCHISINSYPYLVARALGITESFHSVACSGAKVDPNYDLEPQFEKIPQHSSLGVWLPGYKRQYEYFGISGQTSAATVSMVGNDIGFGDILTGCLLSADPCYYYKEDRESLAQSVQDKFGTLIVLYQNIKRDMNDPNAKVYVLGYPQIVGDGPSCDLNTPFSQEERQMARGLTVYLNSVIEAATKVAGVQYIDVTDAFEGHENCQIGTKAVNALSIDKGTAIDGITNILTVTHASFHPNAFGHQLLAEQLLRQSDNFTKPMPVPDLTIQPPFIGSPQYDAFIGDAPSGSTPAHIEYSGSGFVQTVLKSSPYPAPPSTPVLLQPNSSYTVYFRSTPTYAGAFQTDANGNLQGQVNLPDSIAPGFHSVHILGKDVAREDVDLYQTVYVAAAVDDVNGDGIPDVQQQCVMVPPSGIDSDHDDVDDACDGDIASAPVDTVPPDVTGAADRQPDHSGWYNHDVTVSWSAIDPDPSSGSPTQPGSTLANREGDNTYTSDGGCDPAGNCATGSLELRLDKTAPGITFTIEPAPNANGWNSNATIVRFTCSDALSGIESCTGPVTVSGSDGSYIVTGTAVDNAGNMSGVNALVNLDATAPQVTNHLSSEPNQDGWYRGDVTVTPSCSDNLSGIATCGSPTTINQEGASQTVTNIATDNAGNIGSAISTVSLDKTAPTIDSMTWINNPKATLGIATLTVNASDDLSGVRSAEYFMGDADPGVGQGVPMTIAEDTFTTNFGSDLPTGVYKVSVRVQDKAGNWSAITSDYLVVYNPFSINMTGKKFTVPSFANGDNLPGLVASAQQDKASFGFNVGYDAHGQLLHSSDLKFSYLTGSDCNKPEKAQNCHSLMLSAGSIAWFVTQGSNNSMGIFEGSGVLSVDGEQQPVNFWVTGVDSERFNATSPDHLQLRIFTPAQNPNDDSPIYQVNDDILRGNIHIKT